MFANIPFWKYHIWKWDDLIKYNSVAQRVFILFEFWSLNCKFLTETNKINSIGVSKWSSPKYWARIEQTNLSKLNFIEPATTCTSDDLYVVWASLHCEIIANILLWSLLISLCASSFAELPEGGCTRTPLRELSCRLITYFIKLVENKHL